MRIISLLLSAFLLFFFTNSVAAQTTLGGLVVGQGITTPDDWVNYNQTGTPSGVRVNVNTSGCNFETTPHYIPTLESVGAGPHKWLATGVSSVYNATPTGFTVYLRWVDNQITDDGGDNFPVVSNGVTITNPLTAQDAAALNFVVRWTAISLTGCETCGNSTNTSKAVNDADDFNDVEYNTREDISRRLVKRPLDGTLDFTVVPNPASATLSIESNVKFDEYQVFTIGGRQVKSSFTLPIDVSNLSMGSYVLRAIRRSDNSTSSEVFIIE